MDHDMYPSLHGGHAEDAMEMIGRHDLYGIDMLFFIEELPEISVGFTFLVFVIRVVIGIIGFDDGFSAVAASGNSVVTTGFPVGFFRLGADHAFGPIGCPILIADS